VTIDQIQFAADYNAQLIILHVIRADAGVHGIDPPSYIIEMKRQAGANFVKIIGSTNNIKKGVLKMKTDIIAYVRIADAIVGYTKDKHIDLIVTRTRGRRKLKSALRGSVASDVITRAHCPVLIAK
jgi:nucleotide-binding universal stress UspA family protein